MTQHEPCGPVAAGGRGRIRPLILSRARATHTNTHARTHGFLRRHTSPSVTNYCHTPTDMINTRPSANYTPPLNSEHQPIPLSSPLIISTGGSSISGRSEPTATAIGHCPAGHQTWPARPTATAADQMFKTSSVVPLPLALALAFALPAAACSCSRTFKSERQF